MSTTYNGVPANIGAPGSVTNATVISETIPADGDADNAATFNAAYQKLADYIAYILQAGFVGSGASPGISGTGGATGAGVVAIAGGGGSPAAGALLLTPQAAPSAPVNGNAWINSAANSGDLFIRSQGTTLRIPSGGGIISSAPASVSITGTGGAWTLFPRDANGNSKSWGYGAAISINAGVSPNTDLLTLSSIGTYLCILSGEIEPTTAGAYAVGISLNSANPAAGRKADVSAAGSQFASVSFSVVLTTTANTDNLQLAIAGPAGAGTTSVNNNLQLTAIRIA